MDEDTALNSTGFSLKRLSAANFLTTMIRFEKYYEASKLKCTEFEALLIDFAKMVDERQLQKKFGIKSRGFQEYRAEDVLEIAETVQKKYNNTSKVRECTAVFRKCFASVGRNQGAVSNLLSFIPNDSYGSIIFGGFTLILTVSSPHLLLRKFRPLTNSYTGDRTG